MSRKQLKKAICKTEPPATRTAHDWWFSLYLNAQLLSSFHVREKQLLIFRDRDLIPAAAEDAGDLCREQLLRQTGVDLKAVPCWADAQNVLCRGQIHPRRRAGQPRNVGQAEFIALRAEDIRRIDICIFSFLCQHVFYIILHFFQKTRFCVKNRILRTEQYLNFGILLCAKCGFI